MKCIIVFVVCFWILLLCQGCSISPIPENVSSLPKSDSACQTEMPPQSDSANQIEIPPQTDSVSQIETISFNEFYKIIKTNGLYGYVLFDRNGNIAISKSNLLKEPSILILDDGIVRVTTQAGTGIATQSGIYYDSKSNRTSQVYNCIFDQHNNLVVYAKSNKVIIESIFDDNAFYQEISSFQSPFSDVAFPFVNIEFCEDGLAVCITYYSGVDYQKITEKVMLKK